MLARSLIANGLASLDGHGQLAGVATALVQVFTDLGMTGIRIGRNGTGEVGPGGPDSLVRGPPEQSGRAVIPVDDDATCVRDGHGRVDLTPRLVSQVRERGIVGARAATGHMRLSVGCDRSICIVQNPYLSSTETVIPCRQTYLCVPQHDKFRGTMATDLRLGQAAEMLGVTNDTLRRWEDDGRLRTTRSSGGQRLVPIEEVTRLLHARQAERRASGRSERPTVGGSARNRFPGIVTRVQRDGVVAIVELLAGPHRIVSLMTAEAVDDLDLKVGDEAIGVVKATNVIIDIPATREGH